MSHQVVVYDYEICEMTGPIPLSVQIRMLLEKRGIRFDDDGKLSSVINESPNPLGEIIVDRCVENGSTTYKQTIGEASNERAS
jgi:hypothetical protein